MKLKKILEGLDYRLLKGSLDQDIKDVCINSKQVKSGSLFVAIQGFKTDGHNFIGQAADNGAEAVVLQRKPAQDLPLFQVLVKDSRASLAGIAANFFNHPSNKMKLVGITGTNGKTTTCFLINSIFRQAGKNSSMITTVKSFIKDKEIKFDRTTPDALELNRFFDDSVKQGAEAAVMEVSSHSLDLKRVNHICFEGFVFTNLSQDHLDYHHTMDNYFEAKQKLFKPLNRKLYGGKFAVINIDDDYGQKLYQATDLETTGYSLNNESAELKAENIENSIEGLKFDLYYKGKKFLAINSRLSGRFNVYNIMAAVGVVNNMGIDRQVIRQGVEALSGVPGRFEKIDTDMDFTVIVDYAHTPDGLQNVLSTIQQLKKKNSRVITIFGCGGDRDQKKRKIMGAAAGKYSDISIITSDNPRSEDPMAIIAMIEKGFTGSNDYLVIPDRKEAIGEALHLAKTDDIVLIAGKGHEDYQEFADYRIHFSDQEIVRNIL
ncbi:MAG: UDP-N-acetylmuramoyl-L-alanyl-D-glutamate--2,6-diaminopimelate ligase [Actinomycetia bacterium]|nr:UDP-N-acetylmuramoyl-L-alanyl-D-glutamate--2,6-diaminopimelate ligase [Actinomycetes bacterium]